jgi:hypothetical protein
MKKILVLVTVLALVAALAVPLTVSAATTTISGSIGPIVNLTAPNAIALGSMVIGPNTGTSSPAGSFTTNDPKGATVTVASGSDTGVMSNGTLLRGIKMLGYSA